MWLIQEINLLCIILYLFVTGTVALQSISQCAGSQMNMTCWHSNWLLHIVYESYSYQITHNSQCTAVSSSCSDAEFLNAESTRYCNGKSVCSFMVPSDRFLTACYKNATLLTVHYECFPKVQVYNLCSNFTYRHGYSLFLISPGYPGNRLPKSNCECSISGQNITGTILEHEKDGNSPVVMIITTDKATIHVNSVKVLNTIMFSGASKIILMVDNRGYSAQTFKLWMSFKGNDMTLTCGAVLPINPTTTSPISTISNWSSDIINGSNLLDPSPSYTSSDMLPQESDILEPSSMKVTDQFLTISQTPPLHNSDKTSNTDEIKKSDDLIKSKLISSPSSSVIISSTEQQVISLLPSSSLSSMPSSSLSNGESNQNFDGTDNADLYLIIVISCILLVLLLAIIALAVVMIKKEKTHYSAYHLEGDDVIFAYGRFNDVS